MLFTSTVTFALFSGLALGSSSRPRHCVIPASNSTADDSATVNGVFAQCATDSVIVFQEGVDYNIFKPISALNLSNVEIQMKGNLHLPQSIAEIQRIVNGTNRPFYSNGQYWFISRALILIILVHPTSTMDGSTLMVKHGGMPTLSTALELPLGLT